MILLVWHAMPNIMKIAGFLGISAVLTTLINPLAEYGVKPRRNWAAVNLFFNTAIEECHSLTSDVSWSRPGDYVLIKGCG